MKPVQYALAALAVSFVAACGSDTSNGSGAKCNAESTFAQVQQQIFEEQGCTLSACHGESAQGDLDLRPESAYASLINIEASSGSYFRVFPGEQDLSLLYQKVAAKTEGFALGDLSPPISGGAMPTGEGALSEQDLGLLREWIRGGAPETGIVAGSEAFTSCELEGEVAPNKIQPLPPPAADEGVQFYSGAWTVPAAQEGEVCFVSYYDFSDRIPEEFITDCGEEEGGAHGEKCFLYNRALLAQDPQSHHSIIEFYVPPEDKPGQYDPKGPDWDNWVCNGGEKDGDSCTPGGTECGERSQCTTEPLTAIACIGYPNGPREMRGFGGLFGTASSRQNLATAQESSFRETYPENVYGLAPVKGFIIWDSHAFNLTKSDTTIEQWFNLSFVSKNEALYKRKQIFDADDIFGMGRIEPYTSNEACGSFTVPQYGEILTLTSHTHRFGKEFYVWYPPNEVCDNDDDDPYPSCGRPSREPDYESYDYEDPLYQRFGADKRLEFDSSSPDDADRTFRYCAFWDNGESDPAEVRRHSIQPDAETCDFVGTFAPVAQQNNLNLFACGCDAEQRACFGGENEGMACNGDDSVCGEGGICDACPLGGGVTTEEEMFILMGSYYVKDPEL